jgi:hypothetical protein
MINVVRDVPAPVSLSAQKSYRNKEVLDALHAVFLGKCYLTEMVFTSRDEMQIDHFVPQNENPSLIYEWSNLYAAWHRANLTRDRKTRPGGYLDPCNPTHDVEQDVIYVLQFGGKALFKAKEQSNIKAVNTANLLTKLHEELQPAIKERHHQVQNTLIGWYHAREQKNMREEYRYESLLRKLLSRDSQFTMLMRATLGVPADFFD